VIPLLHKERASTQTSLDSNKIRGEHNERIPQGRRTRKTDDSVTKQRRVTPKTRRERQLTLASNRATSHRITLRWISRKQATIILADSTIISRSHYCHVISVGILQALKVKYVTADHREKTVTNGDNGQLISLLLLLLLLSGSIDLLLSLCHFFKFLDPIQIWWKTVDGGSARRKASTYTQDNTNIINTRRHSCLEWD
jgi:hypothetical protein